MSGSDCQDELVCSKLTFNSDVCSLYNVRNRCCDSCTMYCADKPICSKYLSIDAICGLDVQIQNDCPDSCGLCPHVEIHGIWKLKIHRLIIIVIVKLLDWVTSIKTSYFSDDEINNITITPSTESGKFKKR